uniref:CSON005652 protein n=1 Tax=Culicoides sonorensis TaxID=179676 RepID=A0A336LIK5_CULSO
MHHRVFLRSPNHPICCPPKDTELKKVTIDRSFRYSRNGGCDCKSICPVMGSTIIFKLVS